MNNTKFSPLPKQVSQIFDPHKWRSVTGFPDADITYHRGVARKFNAAGEVTAEHDLPVARIAFNRSEVRNAFRPETVDQLFRAIDHARLTGEIGTVILTGNGPSAKDGGWAFCSGGDQRIRGRDGYRYDLPQSENTVSDAGANPSSNADAAALQIQQAELRKAANPARAGRLHILEVQRLMRTSGMVFIGAISGWATGGGHSLNVVCDLSIASLEHARFMQVDANVGSFDAGYGSALLARQVGDKRAREIFFLAREYSAQDAQNWGVVNEAVPHAILEEKALEYAKILATKSPQAIRMLKFAFNLADDGLAGQQVFAGEATRLAYMTAEAQEGRDAFLEKRAPNWDGFPHYA
ncbi:1,4-dihydroxy-2-naphthoyl-CoA synthase [Arcanobacterium hippocoleae]|uniref:1,4-dihydroxy-2-naphthoyl-CoA synthase n=1 Tax=Arcanobacterium hippocoleae TaxID=149017 RepID=A0ABU1T1N6_9ACTO|nr:1,4-dihydroxy-2-naphthoyl-CoA synthase [Arcanobacterium hippocoleae]MDR6939292.1 naphthoate synthase [Arcanobacterium hippocoleae]